MVKVKSCIPDQFTKQQQICKFLVKLFQLNFSHSPPVIRHANCWDTLYLVAPRRFRHHWAANGTAL